MPVVDPERSSDAHALPIAESTERGKTELAHSAPAKTYWYSQTWRSYLDGHVVSEISRCFIQNFLMATAARVVEEPGDSSEDSDDFSYDQAAHKAGNMQLIHITLKGIVAVVLPVRPSRLSSLFRACVQLSVLCVP